MPLYKKIFVLFLTFALFLPALAQADELGDDSPFIGRIPGYYINRHKEQFDRMAPWDANKRETDPIYGNYTEIEYRANDGARQSNLAIAMVYASSIQSMGGQVLGSGNDWGSFLLQVGGANVYIRLEAWSDGNYYSLKILEEGALNLELLQPYGDPAERGADHPYLGRIPGYYVDSHKQQFDRMAPWNESRRDMDPVLGNYTEIQYRPAEGARQSALAIVMAYSSAVQSMGGQVLGSGNEWGSYLFQVNGANVYVRLESWSDGNYINLKILEEGALNIQLTPASGSVAPTEAPALTLTQPSDSVAPTEAPSTPPANQSSAKPNPSPTTENLPFSADDLATLGMSAEEMALLTMLLAGGDNSGDCNILVTMIEFGLLVEQMSVANPRRLLEFESAILALEAEIEVLGDMLLLDPVKSNDICLRARDLYTLMQQ